MRGYIRMKVNINIYSCAGGENSRFCTEGELMRTPEGFIVNYSLDGDGCSLECRGFTVTQRRSGKLTLLMKFEEGENSECILSEGGAKFIIPVFTRTVAAVCGEEGCRVTLLYEQGEERERTELVFVAERRRERDAKRKPAPRA